MFRRPHHQAVATILAALDPAILLQTECYFGGGTAIVLALDEYRESVDIDFLCASQPGYRQLRELCFSGSLEKLLRPGAELQLVRDIRADQYGIRTWIGVGATPVKLEIIREARIPLSGALDPALAVPVLARSDLYCEKLLANADRWADRATLSRDIIDLSVMIHHWGPIPADAWQKAESAYGAAIQRAFDAAVQLILTPDWLRRCLADMTMAPDLADVIRAVCSALLPQQRREKLP